MSKLSKRLEMVANFIDNNDKSVIDIGCDHGLLSIYLANKFKNLKIIASDVNKNALDNAKKNITKCGLNDRIETRLGSGISVINNNDDVVSFDELERNANLDENPIAEEITNDETFKSFDEEDDLDDEDLEEEIDDDDIDFEDNFEEGGDF